jgi:hypothetical protein
MPTGQPTLGRLNSAASCLNIRAHYTRTKARLMASHLGTGCLVRESLSRASLSHRAANTVADTLCKVASAGCRDAAATEPSSLVSVVVCAAGVAIAAWLQGCSDAMSGFDLRAQNVGRRLPLEALTVAADIAVIAG